MWVGLPADKILQVAGGASADAKENFGKRSLTAFVLKNEVLSKGHT